mgnify:CR=1 FL=1
MVKEGRPGVAVIASSSGEVISGLAAFQAAALISGFHRNRLERCSERPCSAASSCSLSLSTLRSMRPTILISNRPGSTVSVPSRFSAIVASFLMWSSISRRSAVASSSCYLQASHMVASSFMSLGKVLVVMQPSLSALHLPSCRHLLQFDVHRC